MNDLPNVSNLETTLFADDTLHLSHQNLTILQNQVEVEINKIDTWIKLNKLIINYNKSCFMIVSKKTMGVTNFEVIISQNSIKLTDKTNVKYLGVCVDNKLTWKTHNDFLSKTLSKVCGMFYKLRHYVPLSTLKLIYHSMFHSHNQYSSLNWGRAAKTHYHKLSVLQNKILRACLFSSTKYKTNLLYSRLKILKIEDMIEMQYAKFMFKFNNQMLPTSFNNYFIILDNVHNHNTRQNIAMNTFRTSLAPKYGEKVFSMSV